MTLPVPTGSEDERARCDHQWKRWPVVNVSLDYQCVLCGEPESIVWVEAHAGKSIEDLDRLLTEACGGVFAGEMIPPPSPEENLRRLMQMLGTGPGTLPFTCPCCGAVSHHPQDAEHGYCGKCHWWTADPVLGPPHLEAPCPSRPSPSLRS